MNREYHRGLVDIKRVTELILISFLAFYFVSIKAYVSLRESDSISGIFPVITILFFTLSLITLSCLAVYVRRVLLQKEIKGGVVNG